VFVGVAVADDPEVGLLEEPQETNVDANPIKTAMAAAP